MLLQFISTLNPTPDQPTTAREAISRPLLVVIVVVGAFIFTRLSHIVIRRVVRYIAQRSISRPSQWWRTRARYQELEQGEVGENRRRQRVDAVSRMLHHLLAVVIWVGVLIAIFHILKLNGPLVLSSAGFLGAGIAYGASQKVNDYLTGLSVLIEDRYGVGDEVEISTAFPNGVRGVVEHIGLVSTRIRDGYSTVHLPHIALIAVRNISQEPVATKISIKLPIDAERGEAALKAAETIRELAGSEHLTAVLLVDEITTATPIGGVDQIELNIRTARPLTAGERETLVRRTEERLSAQDS
ncbi:MAG: mechanosensitive ion channel domain-containing protein [Actinomycetes bacterium]